jgi:hypothetical protein
LRDPILARLQKVTKVIIIATTITKLFKIAIMDEDDVDVDAKIIVEEEAP